jgi:glycine/D-amino acid oxidase-like deaminating enzyme
MSTIVQAHAKEAADVSSVFWKVDGSVRPPRTSRLPSETDVVIVGAGFTGLWTALALLKREPATRVVILEAGRVGDGASGRNGGWLDPFLTHGVINGERHFPAEIAELERLATLNFRGFMADLAEERIACSWEPNGQLELGYQDHHIAELEQRAEAQARYQHPAELLRGSHLQNVVRSPRFNAGVRRHDAGGLLDPYALVGGLANAVERRGALLAEQRRALRLRLDARRVVVATSDGDSIRAGQVLLAVDGATRELLRRTSLRTVPVYDYVDGLSFAGV